jgi:hypothetical protein
MLGIFLIGAGLVGLGLITGVIYYQRKIARIFRDDPAFARAWAIRERVRREKKNAL